MPEALKMAHHVEAHTALLNEIKQHANKRIAEMAVKPGQEISRYISGEVFILDGHAILYRVNDTKRTYIDRLGAGRLYAEKVLQIEPEHELLLVAETECSIAVANLKELRFTTRSLTEKIDNALFNEVHLSCRSAWDQVRNLRAASAKARLLDRGNKLASSQVGFAMGSWMKLDIAPDLFLEMANVNRRQFKRLLPELQSEGLLKMVDNELYVQTQTIGQG